MKLKSILPYFLLTVFLSMLGVAWLRASSPKAKSDFLILDMVGKNPGEVNYVSAFNNPEKLEDFGYNGQVKRDFITGAVTFDSLDLVIFPEGSDARKWVEATAARVEKQINDAKKAGIDIYYFTDIIILPKKIKELYKKEICNEKGNIDFTKPLTKEIHRIMLDEIFRKFPEVDGLVIRTGENYIYDLPYHVGNTPMDALKPMESHVELINFLKEEVCIKRNKKLIYRTWSADSFHYDPEYYLGVTGEIEPHQNLYFSIKHTSGDFHRNTPFNPTIGLGDHKQIIEIQCQREFEGKGAHPNYVGDGVLNGFEEFGSIVQRLKRLLRSEANSLNDIKDNANFSGVWTWSRGGGWYGPYIKNEIWSDLNAYIFATWANNTELSEEEIFNQYSSKVLGLEGEDIARFRELCLLSAQAIVRGRNSLQYPVNEWWTRDDFFGGTEQLERTFTWLVQHGKVEEALKEKAESVEMWCRIVELSMNLDIKDKALKEAIVTSCKYGKLKFSIIHQAWIVMLKGYEGDKTGIYEHKAINEAIANYDAYWLNFNELVDSSPSSASIYRPYSFVSALANGVIDESKLNGGMKSSVDRYRQQVSSN